MSRVLTCFNEARDLADRMSYKPGWAIEVTGSFAMPCLAILRLSWVAPCAVTGAPCVQISATHHIDVVGITERHFINRILWAIKQAEEHETLEFFKLDGVAIYDPHK